MISTSPCVSCGRARQQAASRRYEYFLPAWVIGITGEGEMSHFTPPPHGGILLFPRDGLHGFGVAAEQGRRAGGIDAEEDARRLKLLREALRSFQACLPGLPVCVQASKAADCHMSWRGWDLGRGMGVHKGLRSYQWLESISAGLGAQVTQCQYCIHNSARPS